MSSSQTLSVRVKRNGPFLHGFLFVFFLLTPFLFADEIELRDGTVVTGTVIAQGNATQLPTATQSALFNAPQIWIDTKEGLKKISTSEIRNIRFGARINPIAFSSPSPQPS